MAYEMVWLIPSRVIFIRFSGVVTADDMREQSTRARQMARDGTPPVHIIVHTLGVNKVAFSLMELRRISAYHIEEIGWTVLIRHNPMIQFFGSVALQLIHMRLMVVDTEAEAIAFLKDRDPTLRDAAWPHTIDGAERRK